MDPFPAYASVELHYLWLPLFGFVVGMFATMVGGNGAFFFPPALILLFQVSPRVAIATSLAAVIPIGLIGSYEHYRRGNINLPVGILFGSAGVVGAFTGAWISGMLQPDTLVLTFGFYAVLLGLFTLYLPGKKNDASVSPPGSFADLDKRNMPLILFVGVVSGLVAGVYGTSGTAPVLAGLFILQLPVKVVIGTSVLIVFINAMSGFGGHLLMGEPDLQLIFLLGSGAAAGAFVGPRFLTGIRPERKEHTFRYVLCLLLILLGGWLIYNYI